MASSLSQGRRLGLHPALSRRQGFALLEEAESARNLLRESVEVVRSVRFGYLHGNGMFRLGGLDGIMSAPGALTPVCPAGRPQS
jgi:hypothetical protein